MRKNYPLTLLPDVIRKCFLEDFIKPTPPRPFEKSTSGILGCLAVGMCFFLLLAIFGKGNTGGLTAIGVIVAIIWMIGRHYQAGVNGQRKSEYDNEVKKYNTRLSKYQEYRSTRSRVFFSGDYRKEKLEIVKNAISRPCLKGKSRAGRSENTLYFHLLRWFPGMIYRNYILEIFLESDPYVPDIIFQDIVTNIHIDIEIDEPYSLSDQAPIHCIDLGPDSEKKRNVFFNNHGWIVIRFSESQVLTDPESCCRFVAKVMFNVTRERRWLFFQYRNRNWTYAELDKSKRFILICLSTFDEMSLKWTVLKKAFLKIEQGNDPMDALRDARAHYWKFLPEEPNERGWHKVIKGDLKKRKNHFSPIVTTRWNAIQAMQLATENARSNYTRKLVSQIEVDQLEKQLENKISLGPPKVPSNIIFIGDRDGDSN
jgi:hypothetical protein